MSMGLGQRSAARMAELDRFVKPVFWSFSLKYSHRELLDALHKRGFRTNLGLSETGLGMLVWTKASGYYIGIYTFQNFFRLSN